jgi:hypothetical protein
MIDVVAALKPGQAATIHLRREKKEMDVRLDIGRRPKVAKAEE